MTLLDISLKRRVYNIVPLQPLNWWLQAMQIHTAVISPAMIYKQLKQEYYDAGCFPNNLHNSVRLESNLF